MENKELRNIIRTAAKEKGYKGVMSLVDDCDLRYERVSKVWAGSVNAKLCDVAHVANVLGLEIKFIKRGE